MTDDCYTVYTGSYSQDGSRIQVAKDVAEHANSPLRHAGKIQFIPFEGGLRILNGIDGNRECVLVKTAI